MLYLHIGRGKCGSTTIQGVSKACADDLAALGIHCPQPSAATANYVRVAEEALDPAGGGAELARLIREAGPRDLFVSSEFLFDVGAEAAARVRAAVGDHPTTVLCYIRDYPGWLVSAYAQAAKKGRGVGSFDDFFERRAPSVSAVPSIEGWAAAFGWGAVRVRTLDPAGLHAGSLVADLLRAMGVPDGRFPEPPAGNPSPSWSSLEFARALFAATAGDGAKPAPKAMARAVRLFEAAATHHGVSPRVQYMTPAQWHRAADLYVRDLARLAAQCDAPLPPFVADPPPERPFLPALGEVDVRVRRRFADLARKAAVTGRLDHAVAAAIGRMPAIADASPASAGRSPDRRPDDVAKPSRG